MKRATKLFLIEVAKGLGGALVILIGAIAAFLLVGCAGVDDKSWPQPSTIRLEAAPDQMEAWGTTVDRAFDAWNRELGPDCSMPFVITPDGDCPVRLIPSAEWTWGDWRSGVQDNCWIELRGDDASTIKLRLVEHEFGHAFGMPHDDDPTSIMHPHVTHDITPTDTINARQALGCE